MKLYFVFQLTTLKMCNLISTVARTLGTVSKAMVLSNFFYPHWRAFKKLYNSKSFPNLFVWRQWLRYPGRCQVNDLNSIHTSSVICTVVSWHWLFAFQNQETQQEQKELI